MEFDMRKKELLHENERTCKRERKKIYIEREDHIQEKEHIDEKKKRTRTYYLRTQISLWAKWPASFAPAPS
jgi:hypothetical protein